jgi:hypothetical protein
MPLSLQKIEPVSKKSRIVASLREGIFQTTVDCTDHQDWILAAYDQKHSEEASETARCFLIRMKEYLDSRLPPASSG